MINRSIVKEAGRLCRCLGNGDLIDVMAKYIRSDYTDAEAVVCTDPILRIIWVVFKGSKEFKDWLIDTRFHKDTIGFINDKPVRIHCGFKEAVLSLYDSIIQELYMLQNNLPDFSTILAGHSLGGAMVDAFSILWNSDFELAVTFGKPCFGNEEAVKKIQGNAIHGSFSFINRRDIVPELLDGRFKYVRCGIEIPLKSKWLFSREKPDNVAAGLCNHDIFKDYIAPIATMTDEKFDRLVLSCQK